MFQKPVEHLVILLVKGKIISMTEILKFRTSLFLLFRNDAYPASDLSGE